MALTPSKMIELGSKAPTFNLEEPKTGESVCLDSLDTSKGLLVAFICNHCPYVKHLHPVFAKVLNKAQSQGLAVVAISSNDVDNYPDDSPEKMAELSNEENFEFPYLYDETQEVAKAYDAACTPDLYLFDGDQRLVYRGAFDETRPNQGAPSGNLLNSAIEALLAGKGPVEDQRPSLGCNIKWQ